MTRLAAKCKAVIFELIVDDKRSTVQLIERIARSLKIEVGETEQLEYVKLMHVRHITRKEPMDAN